MVTLFIGNLLWEEEQEIHSLFEQHGKVLECDIIKYYVFGNALAVGPVVRKGAALAPTVRASKLSRAGFHPWSGNLDLAAAAAAKSLQSCSALCDPIDGSP